MGRVVDVFDAMYEEPNPHHEVAEACLNGHVTTSTVGVEPKKTSKFCPRCGQPTIRACPSCSTPLRGAYYEDEIGYLVESYRLPQFCHECGGQFEWTKRIVAEAAAVVRDSGIATGEELAQFSNDIPELVVETPKTVAAASQTRVLLGRLSASARTLVHDILVEVISNAVSGQIFPGK